MAISARVDFNFVRELAEEHFGKAIPSRYSMQLIRAEGLPGTEISFEKGSEHVA